MFAANDTIDQHTEQWYAARAGRFTASRFADLLGGGLGRETYLLEVVNGLVSGQAMPQASASSLQWGTEVEPYAREAYALRSGERVVEGGFIVHPRFDYVGCSPDGLIGHDGGLEMKSPKNPTVHLRTILTKAMPAEHLPQVQGCMWVTGRQWWDFVSYDPRQAPPYRLFVQRIERDDKYIAKLEAAAISAWREVQNMVASLSLEHTGVIHHV